MPELIPMRWPAAWTSASRLELLKGTPINCLVGDAPPPFPLGDLRFIKPDPEHPPEGVVLREGVWPRVLAAAKKDTAGAGPTGGPWVDSNAWVVRLARLMDPGKTVWLTHSPPGGNEVVPLDSFVKPVAEAEAFGAHWVLTLDQSFADALAQGADKARQEWQRVVSALRFFETRRERRSWEPVSPLAVISTFEGEGKLISEEFLNLAPRRHLAYRALRVADAAQASFEKQKAILYLETEPPRGEVLAKLVGFARGGGLLIAPLGTVDAPSEGRQSEHSVRRYGKGRVAMPLEKWEDPFVLVDQVHVLMSHREDAVRVWNGADMDLYHLASPDGRREVVHLIPYASGRTGQVTLGFSRPYRSVRIATLASERAARLAKGGLGVEIDLGEFTDYAEVMLEA
ncbi:MAG: hypothetical protein LAQ30_17650 [Acidobacteriia bacterium]|nr:hypothetical protein [Terriglobia bacterium]